jgi:serine protease Do
MSRIGFLAALGLAACLEVSGAAPTVAPPAAAPDKAAYQHLLDAANAVVALKAKALPNARSLQTLGKERTGSGVLIAPSNLVLTIGYLILEAEQVEVTTAQGRTVPAAIVAYDHATGFGIVRPLAPLQVKPIRLGASSGVEQLDRVLSAAGGGESNVEVATVVSKRKFAGYWEYLIDGAIFTSPPRPDHSGAALINKEGELVGIGSLFVMDAGTPGERLPGNMFVPIDLLKPILQEMVATGRQKGGQRPWLGISSVEDEGRLKVLRVSSEGPAARAGIGAGDLILQVGDKKVTSLEQFYQGLWSTGAPGVEVTLKVLQGSDVKDIRVRSIDRFDYSRKKPSI